MVIGNLERFDNSIEPTLLISLITVMPSNGSIVKYSNLDALKEFFSKCESEILKDENRRLVEYPINAIAPWDSQIIKNANDSLLKNISKSANVYAIFTAEKGKDIYDIRYIGQTNSNGARTRLTNHLIKKHAKTGAKLNKVIDHIQSGGTIQISWISITPESLRHYVEEELIDKYKKVLEWNKHGKKKA